MISCAKDGASHDVKWGCAKTGFPSGGEAEGPGTCKLSTFDDQFWREPAVLNRGLDPCGSCDC